MASYGRCKTGKEATVRSKRARIGVEVVVGIVTSCLGSLRVASGSGRAQPNACLRARFTTTTRRVATCRSGTGQARRHERIRDETKRDDTRRSGTARGEGNEAKRGEASRTEPSQVESSRIGRRVSGWRLLGASGLCYVGFVVLSRSLQTTCAAP